MATITLKTEKSALWSHFVHYMQFLYWCSDIILNDINSKYIIIEPENKSKIEYIKTYCKIISKNFNVTFTNKYDKNNVNYKNIIYKTYPHNGLRKICYFILNDEKKKRYNYELVSKL